MGRTCVLMGPKFKVDAKSLKEGQFVPQGDGYLIRDEKLYHDKFKNYSEYFYHPLLQIPYPSLFEDQGIPYLFPMLRSNFSRLIQRGKSMNTIQVAPAFTWAP